MKIKLTESQYKKVLLREFGETVRDPKEWYLRVLEWVDSSKDLDFETNEYDRITSHLEFVIDSLENVSTNNLNENQIVKRTKHLNSLIREYLCTV